MGTSDIIHTTLLDAQGKGTQAGNYSADSNPFLARTLDHTFDTALKAVNVSGQLKMRQTSVAIA